MWNYRLVKNENNQYDMHEVFYNEDGTVREINPNAMATFSTNNGIALKAFIMRATAAFMEEPLESIEVMVPPQ